jgi:hypothetical protein
LKHEWKESYNIDLTAVHFTCKPCGSRIVVMKSKCTFHSPDEDEDVLEKHNIHIDCDMQRVKQVMES